MRCAANEHSRHCWSAVCPRKHRGRVAKAISKATCFAPHCTWMFTFRSRLLAQIRKDFRACRCADIVCCMGCHETGSTAAIRIATPPFPQ
eukprot:1161393-Pelagomonas_calceolata.AAC.4